MKIALCLSGQPRGIPNTCDFVLDNLVKPNNIEDIFIHTWYDENNVGNLFDSAQPGQSNNIGGWQVDTDKILIEKLNPKLIEFESPKDFSQFKHLHDKPTAIQTRLASMFYSMKKANDLKIKYEEENSFKYDLVIKTRIDLFYKQQLIIDNIVNMNDLKNSIYVPYIHQHSRQNDSYPTTDGNHYSSLSDTFIMGSSENIDKACSLFDDFEHTYSKIHPNQYGEAYIGYHCRFKHALNVIMNSNIDYHIHRG